MKKAKKSTKCLCKPQEQVVETPDANPTSRSYRQDTRSDDQGIQVRVALARKQAAAHAHNTELLPERPGHVRVDGPRRQYRHEVSSDGTLRLIEV